MKTGIALFMLIALGVVFEVKRLWPSLSDITEDQFKHIVLTREDSIVAVGNYKKMVHLNRTGFYKNPFPLSDTKLPLRSHIYYIFGHIVTIGILFLWFKESSEYSKHFVLVFLYFCVGDLIDYLLCYNEAYTTIGAMPITYNVLFTGLYGGFLILKEWKSKI